MHYNGDFYIAHVQARLTGERRGTVAVVLEVSGQETPCKWGSTGFQIELSFKPRGDTSVVRRHRSVHTRTRSLISSGSIRFVWRTLSPHGNDSNTASRLPGAAGYAPPARHTPVNFYRNTFPPWNGWISIRGETTLRIYMILCAPAKQSVTRKQFSFPANPPGEDWRKFGRISSSSALIPSPSAANLN